MAETTRKPRAKKGVIVQELENRTAIPNEIWLDVIDCDSTESAKQYIIDNGKDGVTYRIVTVQAEVKVKHSTTVKVTLE